MNIYNKILKNELFIKSILQIKKLEKDRVFCKHGIEHCLDVARIAYIMSCEKGNVIDKDLIYTCSLLHDIGRGEEYKYGLSHEIAGLHLANSILSDVGCNENYTEEIMGVIEDHRNHEESASELGNIIKKADRLSRICFLCETRKKCKWKDYEKNNIILF